MVTQGFDLTEVKLGDVISYYLSSVNEAKSKLDPEIASMNYIAQLLGVCLHWVPREVNSGGLTNIIDDKRSPEDSEIIG